MDRWILKAVTAVLVTQTLPCVCVLNLASLSYLYLLPDDPLNLSPVHNYLLAVNSYAFGTVLYQMIVKPVRQYAQRNTGSNSHDEGHCPRPR